MKVSLIIPVYNAEKTLPATLASILGQEFRDFEVIFVEDAGKDGSLALLDAFCEQSGLACKLIRQENNQGAAAARNRALNVAEGEYVAFADDDAGPRGCSVSNDSRSCRYRRLGLDTGIGPGGALYAPA